MKRGIAILAVAFCAACDAGQMTDVTPDKETLFLTEACYDPDDSHCVNEYPLWDDPDPTADGYYIGAYTLQDCLWLGIWGDADVDGFDDKCEYRLAHTFAPQLALHGSELDASRETYWAATYFPNDGLYGAGGYVRILYLLGYHWDMGADNCNGCNNHPGDSEWIALDIVFDSLSQHWQFAGVRTSAHGSYNISYPGDVEYPHRVGGYPRIWVAQDKHANYTSTEACALGGFLGTDDCVPWLDEATRVEVKSDRNVGSDGHRLVNGTYSVQPNTYGGVEFMWGSQFCGWNIMTGGYNPCPGGYGQILMNAGFSGDDA